MTDAVDALAGQAGSLMVDGHSGGELSGSELSEAMSSRTSVASILDTSDGGLDQVGKTMVVGGWVKTGRQQGAGSDDPWVFLELNDGSCFKSLQVLVYRSVAEKVGGLKHLTPISTSLLIEGQLKKAPEKASQAVEMSATRILYLGPCDAAKFPLAKSKMSLEYLREKAHLRARTNAIGAIARIRNALAAATHTFFQTRGFMYVHSPIITCSDAEGAGEMFQVTTLLSKVDEVQARPRASEEQLVAKREEVTQQGELVKQAKEAFKTASDAAKAAKKDGAEPAAVAAAEAETASELRRRDAEVRKLVALKEELAAAEETQRYQGGLPRLQGGAVDYREDFFDQAAFLTVSGQLQGEYYASALSNVYTFGPTFRAENSNTSRHLAEFWMIEPEMAWTDLEGNMRLAEAYVQFCCNFLLEKCGQDLDFITQRIDKEARQRLQAVATTPFKRLPYTEAIQILKEAIASKKKKFEFTQVEWGIDLASEHERYLTEEVFKQPVIVYDYPASIKAFYMRMNEDGRTVAAMDVLVPKVGELIGGSQREERLQVLERRMSELGMPSEHYEGYLDLRRFGTVPHSGFGLGFERLILFATGMENIRDVIPFPRWPGHADF